MRAERREGLDDLTVTIPGEFRDSVAGHLANADHTLDDLDVRRFRLVADLLDPKLADAASRADRRPPTRWDGDDGVWFEHDGCRYGPFSDDAAADAAYAKLPAFRAKRDSTDG